MKKYLALGLLSSILLTSCSVDWNDEKEKRIGELEKQVAEIKNIREKEKAANNLDLQDKCSKESKEYFNEYLKDFDISSIYASYSNHYNSSLNKCFIQIKYNHDEILE